MLAFGRILVGAIVNEHVGNVEEDRPTSDEGDVRDMS